MPLTVKHIVEDYGSLWIRGEEEERNQLSIPQSLVSQNTFKKLAQLPQVSARYVIFLERFDGKPDMVWESIQGSHYRNMFILSAQDTRMYYFPDFFQNILTVIFAILVIMMMRVYVLAIKKRYMTYHILGMSARQVKKTYVLECIAFTVFIYGLGVVLSGIFGTLFLSVVFQKLYSIPLFYWLPFILKYGSIYSISAVLALGFLVPYRQIRCRYFVRMKSKKRLIPKNIWSTAIGVSVFSIILTSLIATLFFYFNAINTAALSSDAYGKMSSDFDYEIAIQSPNLAVGQTYYSGQMHISEEANHQSNFLKYYRTNGELETVLDTIRAKFPDVQYAKYYHLSQTYLMDNQQLFDQDYIQKLKEFHVIENHPFWQSFLEKNASMLPVRVIAYPEENLKELSQFFDKSSIESVLSGKSAWVVAPAYEYLELAGSDKGNKTKFTKAIDANHPNAVVDRKIKKGINLDILKLTSQTSAYGIFSDKLAKQVFNHTILTVPVADIAYKQIGWFDLDDLGYKYRLIVSERFLEQYAIDETATRLRLSFPQANYDETNLFIRDLLKDKYQLGLVDQFEKNTLFRDYSLLQKGFKLLLMMIFVVLVVVIFNSFIKGHLLRNQARYELLILLGMKRARLVYSILRPMMLGIVMSCLVVFLIEMRLFIGPIELLSLKDWIKQLLYVILPHLFIIIVIVSSLFLNLNRLMKKAQQEL